MLLESLSIKILDKTLSSNLPPSLEISFVNPLLNEINNRIVFTGGTPEQHTELLQLIMHGFYPLMNQTRLDYLHYFSIPPSYFYQVKLVFKDNKGSGVYVTVEPNDLKVYTEGISINEFFTLYVPNVHCYNNKHKGEILKVKSEKPVIILLDSLENCTDNPQYFISHLLKDNPNCQFICTTNSKDALGVISGYETYSVFNKEIN